MSNQFYIVDDDKSIRVILKKIIQDHDLGQVIGEAGDGEVARRDIMLIRPSIVIIDLLLPGVDGVTLVKELKAACPNVCFVMVSQVTDKEMISKAYLAGVDFFISKPINVIEVVSVLEQIRDKINMHNIIQSLRTAINAIDSPAPPKRPSGEITRSKITSALARLGILGALGSNDIVEMTLLYLEGRENGSEQTVKLNELYSALAQKYQREQNLSINAASVEQRIRRAINKALSHMANMGIEDYGNEFFVSFGSFFFDFTEVRKQMNYIRGDSDIPGKINVKKFIEGLATVIQQD